MDPIPARSLLVVDDEEAYLELVAELLSERLECRVAAFTRPDEALAALPQLGVGLIITDYSMPQMNGVDFLYRAHALVPDAAAVMITGHRIELAGTDFSHVPGLREVLFKPVRLDMLVEQVLKHWPDSAPPPLRQGLGSRTKV